MEYNYYFIVCEENVGTLNEFIENSKEKFKELTNSLCFF